MNNLAKFNGGNKNGSGPTSGGALARQATGTSALVNRPVARADVSHFHQNVQTTRIGFIIDATGSRQHSWDWATGIQEKMFRDVEQEQNPEIRLVHFGGDQLQDRGWHKSSGSLIEVMRHVDCQQGKTQYTPALDIYGKDNKKPRALVLIGDAFEGDVLENAYMQARILGNQDVKIFAFQEGEDETTKVAFNEMAHLTGGAYQQFNENTDLAGLLHGVTAYAMHGAEGLLRLAAGGDEAAERLAKSMRLLGPK